MTKNGTTRGGETAARGNLAGITRRMLLLTRKLSSSNLRDIEIATTPKDEIWNDGKVKLCRYRPRNKSALLGPVLIVQGLFGRYTMTDLQPGRSLVEKLVAGGVDLYVIDWGNPTRADQYRDFSDYADRYLGDALDQIRAVSGHDRAVLLGICQGGVFGLCFAALYPERVKGLVLTVTPVDFHADRADPDPTHGFLYVWSRNLPPVLVEDLIREYGNLPGEMTGAVFQGLAPARTFSKYTTDLIDIAEDDDALETFMRMEKWLADRPDHPGAAAKQWLIELFHQNQLVEGRFTVGGRQVDLGAITCPVLNIYGAKDHIIPPLSSRALRQHLGAAPYEELEVPTGHVGVFVSRHAQRLVPDKIVSWLSALE